MVRPLTMTMIIYDKKSIIVLPKSRCEGNYHHNVIFTVTVRNYRCNSAQLLSYLCTVFKIKLNKYDGNCALIFQ